MNVRAIKTHIFLALTAVWAIFSISIQTASAIPSRPDPPRLVNDMAGLFSSWQSEGLEQMLVAFDDSTSNQIAVITTNDLEGYDISEYATRVGIKWQVGSAEFNNGIVMVVKPKTDDSYGEVFIAVGYGLEGAIPDAYAKRIINNEMIPYFQTGDYYQGVVCACDILMKLASGEISEMRDDDDGVIPSIIATICLIILILIIFSAISGNNNSGKGNGGSGGRHVYRGPIITGGHSSNWGSFGGSGGFGGGFGGFGGGSFGGGGAGGRW